jgi:hypothetical protein
MSEATQKLTLEQAATHLLEECRMVLPGIQALFGFQLVAVFSNRFGELTPGEQRTHLVATMCMVVSIAMVMAPAALHRRREPQLISKRFLVLSSQLLMWSMAPLALGTTLDVYLVARVITQSIPVASAAASLALVAFAVLWGIFPSVVHLDAH